MLDAFDWIRSCRTGSELIGAMKCLQEGIGSSSDKDVGPPLTALARPCMRCWIYPRVDSKQDYCETCLNIILKAKYLGRSSQASLVIWGFVNQLPENIESSEGFYANHTFASYVHDANHFLLVMDRYMLRKCLQEIIMYHGEGIRGLLQVFPTTGDSKRGSMGDVICKAVHQDSRFSMDMLRVRFFSGPYQLFATSRRDKKGLLTFEITEFLRFMEMAYIFRKLLKPDEQEMLQELVSLNNKKEEQFYWGRFIGYLNQEAKDMLNAWKFRQWSDHRVKLLYELIAYVPFN